MEKLKKFIRPALYGLFFVIVALYLSRDFKEEGIYLETDGKIQFLSEPYGEGARTLENLSETINYADGSFTLYFHFSDFSPQSLYLYSTSLWGFREDASFSASDNFEDFHLSIQKKDDDLYFIHSRNLPEGSLIGLAYQQPNDLTLNLLATKQFSGLILDSLSIESDEEAKLDFAKNILTQYPHKPELAGPAEILLNDVGNQTELRELRKAKNESSTRKRKRLLEEFIQTYPSSKHVKTARAELTNIDSETTSRSRSLNSSGIPSTVSRSYLLSLIGNYVSSVNTRDYATAREYVTGGERRALSGYESRKQVLDSRSYTHYDVGSKRAKFYYDDSKSTQFSLVNGEWKISRF